MSADAVRAAEDRRRERARELLQKARARLHRPHYDTDGSLYFALMARFEESLDLLIEAVGLLDPSGPVASEGILTDAGGGKKIMEGP